MENNTTTKFHYAFHVKDLNDTRSFYMDILGCKEGRSTEKWIDFNFFGHQLSAHLGEVKELDWSGEVDGKKVPLPHFGAIIDLKDFMEITTKMRTAGKQFVIEPYIRYQGKPSAQWTMFVLDPSGNPLEFKSFLNNEEIFK
ncbi:MAG: VOC family protein [Saprospiraceae bacterium]